MAKQTIIFCNKCHLRSPENLYKNKWCKLCARERAKTREQKDRQYISSRTRALKRTFGITIAQYNAMFEKQIRTFNVDHNHITGKVRGLLCSTCNSGIGSLKDSIELLQAAIKYLTETN